MPTKLRYLLTCGQGQNNTYLGCSAISVVLEQGHKMAKRGLIPNWNNLTQTEKLRQSMRFFHPIWTLYILREPRRARKNKSAYFALRGQQED